MDSILVSLIFQQHVWNSPQLYNEVALTWKKQYKTIFVKEMDRINQKLGSSFLIFIALRLKKTGTFGATSSVCFQPSNAYTSLYLLNISVGMISHDKCAKQLIIMPGVCFSWQHSSGSQYEFVSWMWTLTGNQMVKETTLIISGRINTSIWIGCHL